MQTQTQKALNIRAEIENAAQAIAAKHGLGVSLGTITHGAGEYSVNVSLVPTNDAGEPMTAERRALEMLYPGVYGKTYNVPRAGTIKPIGYKSSNHKYPIIYIGADGRRYKAPRSFGDYFTEDWEVK